MYTVEGKNLMLDALGDAGVWVSLHSDDPGETGDHELSGGSPAYARQPLTWSAAAGGEKEAALGDVTFDVPAGATVAYVGLWSDEVGGDLLGYDEVTEETYAEQGRYELSSFMMDLNLDVA